MTADLRAWSPIFVRSSGEPSIEWAILDGPPRDGFFEVAAQRAMSHPFNLLFSQRTPLDVLDDPEDAPVTPSGLIFHMSRSGSTVAAKMLAQLPSTVVLSEAQPLDALIRLRRASPAETDATFVRRFRAMVTALARPFGRERSVVVKLHAWHVVELPLIRAAFPDVPAIFLFREPRAVLLSQSRVAGLELSPQMLDPRWLGLGDTWPETSHEYAARFLGVLCAAALHAAERHPLIYVDYATLPDAVVRRIAPYFGLSVDGNEAGMRAAAVRDAKSPVPFRPREAAVTPEIERLAARWIDPAYAALRDAAG
jgi:hypothetical protein